MLKHTELFSNVSGLGLIHCGLGLEKIFGPRPRPHFFWSRPWPHAQLASLTSLQRSRQNSTGVTVTPCNEGAKCRRDAAYCRRHRTFRRQCLCACLFVGHTGPLDQSELDLLWYCDTRMLKDDCHRTENMRSVKQTSWQKRETKAVFWRQPSCSYLASSTQSTWTQTSKCQNKRDT